MLFKTLVTIGIATIIVFSPLRNSKIVDILIEITGG